MCFFGYESLGFTKDPEHCYASDDSNFRATNLDAASQDDNFVDVGQRFNVVFTIAFYASLIMTIAGIFHCIDLKAIRLVSRAVGTIAIIVAGISLTTGVIFRVLHSGRVCSGDYMGVEDLKSSGYLAS